MLKASSQSPSVRFGPFAVSFTARELRKHGTRIRLPGQPFDILTILLEHAGEVVSREEIRQRLWAADTFVDFEHGVNNAVKKLRAALGDSAENPQYVETLARVGYRFIASVDGTESVSKPEQKHSGASWKWIFSIAMVALVVVASGYLYLHRRAKLSDKDTIVLADFKNTTSDQVFDGTLRQGLAVQLEQSPFLSIVSEQQLQQTLQMMGQNPDAKITPEIARELCQRVGSAAVLEGAIAQIGSQYLLTVKAANCVSGESQASAEATASDKNHVLDALGKVSVELRNKLGESLSTVKKYDTPLEEATTPSLEALKALSSGNRVLFATGSSAAIPFYKHAIELDPKFALAYALLGRTHADVGEFSAAAGYTQTAYELRERTSEPEKYFISAHYHIAVTGNMEKAEQTCKLWAEAYPRAEMPHNFLSGLIYAVLGQYEKSAEEGAQGLQRSPNDPIPYEAQMFAYIGMNRIEQAKATYAQAMAHKLNHTLFSAALYEIAFLQNDLGGMTQELEWSAGKPGVEDGLLAAKADAAAYSGRLKEAREISRRAIDSAERTQEGEAAATYSAVTALREALFGNAGEARKRAELALQRSAGRDVRYGAALALAYAGDEARAHALTEDLGKQFPEDTIVQFNYLPTLRAKLAINRKNPSEAIEKLRGAAPYELGAQPSDTYYWNALYPAFVRAEAYLIARQGNEAAAEFQKIIDERGVAIYEPIGALAHLGLARAFALSGDTSKARSKYEDFLALWKDADPDIPILRQAKREFNNLQ